MWQINKNKIVFLIPILLLLAVSYFLFTTNTLEIDNEPNIDTKQVFKSTEQLSFVIDISQKPSISLLKDITKKVYAQETNTYVQGNITIKPAIINTSSNKPLETNLAFESISDTEILVTADNETTNLVPGGYKILVEVTDGEETYTITQDFTWGVLAINPNKSIYLPGQTAILGMAVLDEKGEMVCDANVTLEVTNPHGISIYYSTSDNTININPNCHKKEYIPSPDFEAKHTVSTLGTYNLKLTAITTNGSYTIEDSFEVRASVPFDIERKTATRIYPPVYYPVTINIKAHEDFSGTIEEYVPASFEISNVMKNTVEREINEEYNPNYEGIQLVQKIEIEPDQNTKYQIFQKSSKKIISWEVDAKKGDEIQLQYTYKAPDISPEFYLLGPITLINTEQFQVFKELRQWQIAGDAIAYVNVNVTTSNNSASAAPSLTATANNLLVLFCQIKSNQAITLTGSGWTNVYSEAGTPTQYTWYKISAGGTESPSCSWTTSDFSGAMMLEYSGVDTSSPLDTNGTATGSDATVECPSLTPSAGNHVYVVGLVSNAGNVTISSWTNTFTQRVNQNTNAGSPAARIVHGAADKITTGTQSTTATVGASGAWRCHSIAFNEGAAGDSITGRAFTDDNEVTPLSSVSVCGVANNGTPVCNTTDGSGVFTLTIDTAANDQLTFFVDGGTDFGNTVTVADGGDIVTGDNLRVYENHVGVRYETGTSITIAQMDAYDNTHNATDMLFDATDAATDTLSVEDPNELFVFSGYTFAPGGNITASHDIEIDGVWTAATGETINLSGTFKQDVGGTFNPSTSTVTFDGTGGIEDLITDGTGDLYNLVLNDGGNNLTVEVEDPLTVINGVTITGGTLDTKSGESNAITVHGNWANNDQFEAQSGLVTFDGSGATTYTIDGDGPGTLEAFYDVTFNDQAGGATYQLTSLLDVDDDLTITGGTLDSNGNNITVGGNWTNDDIFTEGTATVTLDVGKDATLDTGCVTAATCTDQNFYNLTINKGNGGGKVTLSPNDLRVTNTFTITSGEFIQSTNNIQLEGTTALQVNNGGVYSNLSTGNLTLGGSVVNDFGSIVLNSNGAACGDADSIQIRSTAAAQRSWSGSGSNVLVDVDIEYQAGSATIRAADSTNSLNNGSNFEFVACNILYINGLNFNGVNID